MNGTGEGLFVKGEPLSKERLRAYLTKACAIAYYLDIE